MCLCLSAALPQTQTHKLEKLTSEAKSFPVTQGIFLTFQNLNLHRHFQNQKFATVLGKINHF
jgi:hypothetical protein